MITRINPVGVEASNKKTKLTHASKAASVSYQSQTSLMSKNAANAIKAFNSVSFKGTGELTPLEKSFIKKMEIRIPNILDLNEDIHIPADKMPEGRQSINIAGLSVKAADTLVSKIYTITNDVGDTIFVGEIEKDLKDKPVLTYKQGKYMPEITIKDKSLGKGRIKMFAGSQVKGEGFNLVMPGDFRANPGKKNKENISFTGNVYITTLNKEKNTMDAVDRYIDGNMADKTIYGDYDDVTFNQPSFVIPAGGFGERFYNIPRDKENKPSAKLPTSDNYRVMATALNLIASTGALDGVISDDIIYLSQNGELGVGDGIYQTRKYGTDGGAITEGLTRGIIEDDKDMIVLNADIFTNADITHAYHSLKTLPNAALVIPYYPVDAQRAKSFGLMAVDKDEQGNLVVNSFIEKPQYTTPPQGDHFRGADHGDYSKALAEYIEVRKAKLPNGNKFMANPGLYFISKEAVKVMTAMGLLETGFKKDEDGNVKLYSNTGLGKHIMPKIVELANNGMLLDENGKQMKVYTVPLEAKGENRPAVWDDIGTAAAYLSLIKDVAWETSKNGTGEKNKYYGVPEFVLEDFKKNVDLKTGIVFSSPDAKESLEKFKEKYNVQTAKGNIFVTTD